VFPRSQMWPLIRMGRIVYQRFWREQMIYCGLVDWLRRLPVARRWGRDRLHGSHRARRPTMQPVQLSLIPDQVPAPPEHLIGSLPPAHVSAATQVLTLLIAKAAAAQIAGAGDE
jgi:hypothetical protein